MRTSWHGHLFCITVSLWVDSTGHKWFPSKSVSFADLWCLLCCESEQAVVKHSSGRWFETPWCSYDSSAMGLPIQLNIWTIRQKQQFWAKVLIHYYQINTKPLEHLDIIWGVNCIQAFIGSTYYCSTLMNEIHSFKIENICSNISVDYWEALNDIAILWNYHKYRSISFRHKHC